VPLADGSGGVAEILEPVGHRPFGQCQPDALADAVELVAEARRVAAGHQPGTRRAAIRRGNVALSEPDSVSCDGVDVGRGDVAGSLEAEPTIADVVAQDDQDIGLAGLGGAGRSTRREAESAQGKLDQQRSAHGTVTSWRAGRSHRVREAHHSACHGGNSVRCTHPTAYA
jgi:hypothetical protein